MARNHKFFFDKDGSPKARGPAAEKVLMSFLEVDVQGSDHICRVLMDDLTAIEDESDDSREFIGNAHTVTFTPEGVSISLNEPAEEPAPAAEVRTAADSAVMPETMATGEPYTVALKHFREILEDWEAFILDDQIDDPMAGEDYL